MAIRRRGHVGQVQRLLLEHDLALGNARDVQQVVQQPGHVRDLAVDDVALALQGLLVGAHQMQNLHGVADRSQRV